jgi:hypothetical protein
MTIAPAPEPEEIRVERVAWAIAAESEGLAPLSWSDWEYHFDEDEQNGFRRLARAAIAALESR